MKRMPVKEFMSQQEWGFAANAGFNLKRFVKILADYGISEDNIDIHINREPDYSDSLYIKVGDPLPLDLACVIAEAHADEYSWMENGWLYMWWD